MTNEEQQTLRAVRAALDGERGPADRTCWPVTVEDVYRAMTEAGIRRHAIGRLRLSRMLQDLARTGMPGESVLVTYLVQHDANPRLGVPRTFSLSPQGREYVEGVLGRLGVLA